MKTFLLMIAFAVSLSAAPKCFESYSDAAYTIEKKHIKTQALGAKQKIRYVYDFDNITMFPFFCLKQDTLERYLITHTEVVYLCQFEKTIRKFKDSLGNSHVQIVILNYNQPAKGAPSFKTYTLYFLKQEKDSTWVEERDPVVVTIKLMNREKEEYQCR
jgi:hypothetical protein